MNTSLVRAFVAAASLASFYLVFDGKARADDWGCQVILCLSNPGGPTQYAECRPPIEKLSRACKGTLFSGLQRRWVPGLAPRIRAVLLQ